MDKQYFQRMFCATSGCVYQYTGTVPEDQPTSAYVTEEFLRDIATRSIINTVVVETPQAIVLFTQSQDLTTPDGFTLLADLTPDVVVVEVPPTNEGGV